MSTKQVSHAQRFELLVRSPIFSSLPAVVIDHVAKVCTETHCHKNDVIVHEGDTASGMYILAKGEARVVQKSASGVIELGTLYNGDVFGEAGLLSLSNTRTATVEASDECILLYIEKSNFELLLSEFHDFKKNLLKATEIYEVASALKRNAYFASVEASILRLLAKRLQTLFVNAGTVIVQQDEVGECCYYLKSGEVNVTQVQPDGSTKELAVLKEGELFGETSVITNNPRNATITALTTCKLLLIKKADLLKILEEKQHVSRNVANLLFLRHQPKKCPDVQIASTREAGQEKSYQLINSKTGSSITLNEEEMYVWEQVDGKKNLKDLTLAFHGKFNVFTPQRVSEILSELIVTGMVASGKREFSINDPDQPKSKLQKLWQRFKHMMEWKVVLYDVDQKVTETYNRFFHLIFTTPVQILFVAIALLGFVVFVSQYHYFSTIKTSLSSLSLILLIVFPATFLAALSHEAAHAFTMKAFGRSVLGIGFGWHWLGPAIFVDTSDMWLADKWQRVAVRLAGLYANVVLAGFSSAALLLPLPVLCSQALWFFSMSSYIMVLIYLNPFIKSYGYFAKKDLESPANPHL